ncbi:hypothetical protein HMI54_014778 [Coelomomyces lativittatus]|nr:hypothetical protein HMI56_003219 [Coelomomyces lativittatus]KAJ1513688.1 hypothetical protein HMI54_014778 [Coelomomyces lativittatus]
MIFSVSLFYGLWLFFHVPLGKCIFGSPSLVRHASVRIPLVSQEEAASRAAHFLRSHHVGTLCTVMSEGPFHDQAYGSFEYYASTCPLPSTSSSSFFKPPPLWDNPFPFLFLSGLSQNVKNGFQRFPSRFNATLAIHELTTEVHMDSPRLTLFGHLISIPINASMFHQAWECYVAQHPDAKPWKKMMDTGHAFKFYQLVVDGIYWIGGFGGLHYIGFIDKEVYKRAFLTLA